MQGPFKEDGSTPCGTGVAVEPAYPLQYVVFEKQLEMDDRALRVDLVEKVYSRNDRVNYSKSVYHRFFSTSL